MGMIGVNVRFGLNVGSLLNLAYLVNGFLSVTLNQLELISVLIF